MVPVGIPRSDFAAFEHTLCALGGSSLHSGAGALGGISYSRTKESDCGLRTEYVHSMLGVDSTDLFSKLRQSVYMYRNFLVFLVAAPPEAWWALSFLPSHASPSWLEIHALAARIVGYSRPSQMCMLAVQCTIKQCWLRLRSSVCAQ